MAATEADGRKRTGVRVVTLAEQIKAAILDGTFRSGESLSEVKIMSSFACSRTSAREALRLVINSGLIAKAPNQSNRVVSLNERDLQQLRSLRMVLERFAGTVAFGRQSLIEGLEIAVEEMRVAVAHDSHGEIRKADRRFHEALVRAADHDRLTDIYLQLSDQIEFALLAVSKRRRHASRILADHEELLDMVKNGSLRQFLDALSVHVQQGLGADINPGRSVPDEDIYSIGN